MWKAILRFSRKSVMVAGLCVGLTPITAQATIQLETWQSYGGMAEQGAICAAFSRLMELQSLVDPRIGKLWQERHRYAGSVISKAATLEGVEELTSADINGLVDRYAAWLMTNLTEAGYATMINGDAHAAATKMIGDVCTKIYQRADQSIIKTHPELAECAVAGNCSDPAAPVEPPASQSAQNHQADLKRLMRQNLALQQKIDILESAATPASVPANTPDPVQQAPKMAAQPASVTPASPQPAPANKRNIASDNIGNGNIGMGGLDVAFAIPSKPSTSGYRVHIGTYRNETDAHRAHHLLEQLDHYLLDHVFFNVAPQQRRNAIYYDLVSAPLPKHHVTALCAVLWQQKMGCSASFAP